MLVYEVATGEDYDLVQLDLVQLAASFCHVFTNKGDSAMRRRRSRRKKRKTGYDARPKKFTQQVNIERRGGSTRRSAKVRRVRRNRDVTEEEFEL